MNNLGELQRAGMTFKENFKSALFVARNGFSISGSPEIGNGVAFTGSEYLELGASSCPAIFYHNELTIVIKCTFDFVPGDGTARMIYDSFNHNSNRNYFSIGTSGTITISHNNVSMFSVVYSSYSDYLTAGENVFVVSMKNSSSELWLNGVSLGTSAAAYSKNSMTNFVIGARYNYTALQFEGTISRFEVWNKKFTQNDVDSYFSMGENINSSKARAAFPFSKAYQRSSDSKFVTPYIGQNQGEVLLGTGTTSMPDKLFPNGFDFEASNFDYINCQSSDVFSFGDGSGNDDAFTMVCYSDVESLGSYNGFASKGTSTTFETLFRFTAPTFEFYLGNTTSDCIGIVSPSKTDYLTTGTSSFAITYDASKVNTGLNLYQNGELLSCTRTAVGTYAGMKNLGSDFCIGKYSSGYYDGKMKRFFIYNKDLSPLEMKILSRRLERGF